MSYNSRDKAKQQGKYLCRLNRSFVLAKHDVTFIYVYIYSIYIHSLYMCVCILLLLKLVTSY
jgi:hypothetical protein